MAQPMTDAAGSLAPDPTGLTEPKAERVQVVFKVPQETKDLLARTARDLGASMNAAACERLITGKWPQE
jgi:hypothetical protein